MEANSDLNDTDPETIVEMNSNAPTPVMRTVAETDPPETLLEPSERNREEESLSIICSLIDSPLLLEATARNGMEETLPVSNSHNDSPSESHGSYSNMTEEITEISKGERFSHPSPDETYDVFEDDRNEPESRQKNVAVTTNHHFPFNQGLDDSAETRNGHQESSISTRAQPHIESLEVAVESVKTHKTNMSCLKEEQTLRNQPLPLQRKESTRLPISEKELKNTLVSNTTDLNRNEINSKVNQSNLRHRDAPIGDNAASRPKNNLPIRDLENEVSVERSNGSHIRKKQRPIQSYPKGCYDQTLNGKPVRNPVDMSDGGLNHLLDGRVAQSRLITSVSAEDNASDNILNQRHFHMRRRWTRRRIDGPPSNDEGEILASSHEP